MASVLGRVLILGYDRVSMDTWRAVLEHFWPIHVRVLESPEHETLEKLAGDLIVLSSTIPSEEQQDWVDRIRVRLPHILLVRVNGFDSGPHAGADATVDDLHGPGALVSTIYELLTERGLASRAWPIPGEPPVLH